MNTTRSIVLTAAATSLIGAGLLTSVADATTEPPTPDTDLARAGEAALAETGDGTVTAYEADLDGYHVEVRLIDGTDVDVDLDVDFVVVRTRPDDRDGDDRYLDIDDVDLHGAHDAALAAIGEGTVVKVEVDDGGGYDAEIIQDGGTELELDLTADFEVVRVERDD